MVLAKLLHLSVPHFPLYEMCVPPLGVLAEDQMNQYTQCARKTAEHSLSAIEALTYEGGKGALE